MFTEYYDLIKKKSYTINVDKTEHKCEYKTPLTFFANAGGGGGGGGGATGGGDTSGGTGSGGGGGGPTGGNN